MRRKWVWRRAQVSKAEHSKGTSREKKSEKRQRHTFSINTI